MANKTMYDLGNVSSVIRELFDYGQKQAALIGSENVFDFSIGNPSIPAPDCVKESIVRRVTELPSAAVHGYTSAAGDPQVRQTLADYMNKTCGANVNGGDFYMTCGAAASLSITLTAIVESSEDEIVLLAPFFPEYSVFIANAGARRVVLPPDTKNFQIDFVTLSSMITQHTRAVIVNSPNNPVGNVYTAETFTRLAELLSARSKEYGHTIYIISDEPYREIVYDGAPVLYVPNFYRDTIICYSWSKSLSLPGERIGYILVPETVSGHDTVYKAVCGAGRSLGFVCAPHLFQNVIADCIGMTSDLSVYDSNRKLLYGGLKEIGYDCVYPGGAFYLFVKSPEPDANAFSAKAKALNLLLVPADSFGCPGYVRVSYCVDPEMIRRSFTAFRRLWKEYHPA